MIYKDILGVGTILLCYICVGVEKITTPNLTLKGSAMRHNDYVKLCDEIALDAIFYSAHNAGNAAVTQTAVTPMIVSQQANPLNDNSETVKQWVVNDGVCGFASVIIKPANSKFAKFLVANQLARKHYAGGVSMSIRDFNQSLTKKEAYAYAFSKVLNDNGITAHVDSRMD